MLAFVSELTNNMKQDKQIDFKNAFVQSSLPNPIYLELPLGGYKDHPLPVDLSWKFHKVSMETNAHSNYGLSIVDGSSFPQYGFTTHNSIDPCLFICPNSAIVLYMDDAIIVSQNQSIVKSLISQLEANGLDLTCKGTFAHYLGVKIDLDNSGHLIFT